MSQEQTEQERLQLLATEIQSLTENLGARGKWPIKKLERLVAESLELAINDDLIDVVEALESFQSELNKSMTKKSQTKARRGKLQAGASDVVNVVAVSFEPDEVTDVSAELDAVPEIEEGPASEPEAEVSAELEAAPSVDEVVDVSEELEAVPDVEDLVDVSAELDAVPDVEEPEPEPAPEPEPEPEPDFGGDAELMQILRAAFLEESAAAFPELESGLAKFQSLTDPEERAKSLEPVFRAAHSIKGAARAIELHEAEMVAAALEEKLRAGAKPESAHYSERHFAILQDGIELLKTIADSYRKDSRPPSRKKLQSMVEALSSVEAIAPPVEVESEPVPEPSTSGDLESLLRETFLEEAGEQLPVLRSGVAKQTFSAHKDPDKLVSDMFRAAHSLRGAARAVEFPEMESLCMLLEERIREVHEKKAYAVGGEVMDVLRKGVLMAERLGKTFESGEMQIDDSKLQPILLDLEILEISESPVEPPKADPVSPQATDSKTPAPKKASKTEKAKAKSKDKAESKDKGESKAKKDAKSKKSKKKTEPKVEDSIELNQVLLDSFRGEAESFSQEFFGGIEHYKDSETAEERAKSLEPVFRAVHGLRGAARAVELTEAEILTSALEQKLREAKQPHRSYLSRTDLSALEKAGETLKSAVSAHLDGSRGPSRNQIRSVLDAVEKMDPGAPEQSIEMAFELPPPEKVEAPGLTDIERLFGEEAEDYILSINQQLVELERNKTGKKAEDGLEQIFRDVHSLKGASRSVGMDRVEQVCQGLETVYARVKRGELELNQQTIDVSFRSIDMVAKLLDGKTVTAEELSEMDLELESVAQGQGQVQTAGRSKKVRKAVSKPPTPSPAPVASVSSSPERETVRLPVAKLDDLLLQSEEMLTIKLKAMQRTNELREVGLFVDGFDREFSKLSPSLANLKSQDQEVKNLVEFVQWSQRYIRSLESQVDGVFRRSVQDERTTRALVDNLLEDAKQLLLFPFSTLLDRFPRLVRDLGRDLGREVEFRVSGSDIEIDRRILDELRDPLTHLIRNAVDHGLESPHDRKSVGKNRKGRLTIDVSRETAEHILVEVRDDGGGIDPGRIRKKAIAKGLYTEKAANALSDQELIDMIFLSDFSTTEQVTEVSGRGLGMPIVADKIGALGGTVTVRSQLGKGTRFLLRLPIRRATYNGILVSSGDQVVVIPTASVVSVHRFHFEDDIKTMEGQATVEVMGRIVPIVRLEESLGFQRRSQASTSPWLLAVLMEYRGTQAAFIVDELLAEQEILAKKPSYPLDRIPTLAGSTILGNGNVAPILDVAALVEPLGKSKRKTAREEVAPLRPKTEQFKILLCDDSITSRTLLTHILSNAGYNVDPKIDGALAYDALLEGQYDLLCSDVEMPNMTGLELCAKVRQTPGFEDLPIVLVTTLDEPEDHQKGADAGASAYVVKGRLDQDHLLKTVEFLLS